MIIITSVEARQLLAAGEVDATHVEVSTDLGRTRESAVLSAQGVRFADGTQMPWEAIQGIRESKQRCFAWRDGRLEKIQVYSELTDRCYVLFPTSTAPTALNAGIPMHRVKGIDPLEDVRRRIRTIAPIRGRVFDTATGMGYSALAAAKTAGQVVTAELDPAMVELARRNPWSRPLFESRNIERMIGDSTVLIGRFEDESFSTVVHDPPTIQLAGEMYSRAFYEQVHRVLASNGRLFHYIGDLRSRLGDRVARGVVRRLREVGFRRIQPRPDAFGLVARK